MGFAGRLELLDLAGQLVAADAGPLITADDPRPVLVIEGRGGSGRSEVLREISERWAGRAMTAEVEPRLLPLAAPGVPRPLIAAVLLGFWRSTRVPGFEKVAFERVILAHIAMSAPVQSADPALAVEEMRRRLNEYRDRGAVIELVGDLVRAGIKALSLPTSAMPLVPVVADTAAKGIVSRLRRSRWVNQLGWGEALEWFGHQDQQLRHDPMRVLVQLSRQVQLQTAGVADTVDDLLVGALLADVRHGLARVANRPSNAVILLDDADTVEAVGFVDALGRVRTSLAAKRTAPDPLTVIVAGGELTSSMVEDPTWRFRWLESEIGGLTRDDVHRAGHRLAVVLGDLSVAEVEQLVREYLWPAELGTGAIAQTVHNLTHGHPLGTTLVVQALQDDPTLLSDLPRVLRRASPTSGKALDEFLVERVTTGLGLTPGLRENLITLAAARDRDEAETLTTLLRATGDPDVGLLTSGTLWSVPGPRGRPAMPPFVRLLLLRRLAARPAEHPTSWSAVFEALVAATSELEGLPHRMLLGETDQVAGVLAGRLRGADGEQWLAALDRAVEVSPLRRPASPDPLVDDPADVSPEAGVARLVAVLPELSAPRLAPSDELSQQHVIVSHTYAQLARYPATARQLLVARSKRHRLLAERLV